MLSVKIDHKTNAVVLRPRGEIDHGSVTQLDEVSATLPDQANVVVDFAEVTFCDSSGLTWLVQTHRNLSVRGGGLRLTAVPATLARTMSLVGLDEFIPVFPDLVSAVLGTTSENDRSDPAGLRPATTNDGQAS